MNATIAKLAASILAADFARLGEQVAEAERCGAAPIQEDVMDGHFSRSIQHMTWRWREELMMQRHRWPWRPGQMSWQPEPRYSVTAREWLQP